jgi:hypothetical protein
VKKSSLQRFLIGTFFFILLFGTAAIAASTGTIDPAGTGEYKAAFLDTSVVPDPSINFGSFTTEAQYNITVSDSELRGYAWGSSVGYMVMNCADTASGCSATNGNFKVANDGTGVLSGYAWGDNTGWINFGPFTDPAIMTVKIDNATGNFGGGPTSSPGYAWSQNYGWIVFDCNNANTCVNTSWRMASSGGGSSGGGGGGGGGAGGTGSTGTTPPTNPPGTPPVTPPRHHHRKPSSPVISGGGGGGTGTTQPSQPPGVSPTQPVTPPPTNPPQPPFVPSQQPQQPTGPVSTFVTSVNTILSSLGGALGTISSVGNLAQPAVQGVLDAVRTPLGKAIANAAGIVGAVGTATGAGLVLIVANPGILAELFLLPFRLWTWLLILLGFKKRSRPWGTVYNSVTKQPVDPAYVMLMDMQGNEVATSITDINGRYGFSVAPGTYKIVANKTNFTFPSTKLAGHNVDELYSSLYFGEAIVVKEEGEIIAKNIPMDQQNFDWNEFAKDEQHRLSYYRHSDLVIARVANVFFWLGFAISAISLIASHTVYNAAIFLIYIIIFGVRHYSPQFKTKGAITDALSDQPLPFAILHVLSAATGQEITHKVADRLGNYYCLVPNGTYNVVIDRKNPDAGYTKIPVPEPVVVRGGTLQQSFTV